MSRLESKIDLAVLSPTPKATDIVEACDLARKHNMASVCVYPIDLILVDRLLYGSNVKVSTVIGFPFGNQLTDIKCEETRRAIDDGAQELDMVMKLASFADGQTINVMLGIQRVVEAADGTPVKVIIETGYWDTSGILKASKLVEDAGAAYVKTCTGFGPRGVNHKEIDLIYSAVDLPIKASGGIKTRADAEEYIKQGCSRLGIGIGSIKRILK